MLLLNIFEQFKTETGPAKFSIILIYVKYKAFAFAYMAIMLNESA